VIDLRSDTVTKPTDEMLNHMSRASVGDDVFGEDETVNAFQQQMADHFGFEAGLFVPSGVMANQISLNVLSKPGDEALIEAKGHMFNYENASASLLSSVLLRPLEGVNGKLSADLINPQVRGRFDWEPNTSVVILENTTNKGGGVCYTKEELTKIKEVADAHSLHIHLDGARIWNALTATGMEPPFFGSIADTMNICFSKGLGAPVGSMLLSTQKRIAAARRVRKMIGGGMRQTGLLAAAAAYAVEYHFPLLKQDHKRAQKLATAISKMKGLSINPKTVETNIVLFDVVDTSAAKALEMLSGHDIQMVPFGPKTIRATLHFQVDDEQIDQTIKVLNKLFG